MKFVSDNRQISDSGDPVAKIRISKRRKGEESGRQKYEN